VIQPRPKRSSNARRFFAFSDNPDDTSTAACEFLAKQLCEASVLGNSQRMSMRTVLDALSKAMVTVAVMLSILLIAKGPASADPARTLTAWLLAAGTFGLVALNLSARPSSRR
jgi:hypothetical protein